MASNIVEGAHDVTAAFDRHPGASMQRDCLPSQDAALLNGIIGIIGIPSQDQPLLLTQAEVTCTLGGAWKVFCLASNLPHGELQPALQATLKGLTAQKASHANFT